MNGVKALMLTISNKNLLFDYILFDSMNLRGFFYYQLH